MKKISIYTFLFILFTTVLSGCFLQAIHPLVTPQDSKLVNGLEGVWEEDEGSRWYFINDPNNFRIYMGSDDNPYTEDDPMSQGEAYFIFHVTTYDGKTDTTGFVGSTIELNGSQYLDMYFVNDKPFEEYNLSDYHLFPVHTFSKISVSGDSLGIEFFESKWISEQLLNNRVRLKHERISSGSSTVLITASTKELQQFVTKYGNVEKAYEDPLILKRIM